MADLLLVIPPLTQMNTPYPSTAYLAGYLRSQGFNVDQCDWGLELMIELLSKSGISSVAEEAEKIPREERSEALQFFIESQEDYVSTVEPVLRFLQGKDSSLALRIAERTLLPEGPRFLPLLDHPEILDFFGTLGTQDKAKYLASLYIDDLNDFIRESVDPEFELAKYAERLAASQPSFDPLLEKLLAPPNLIDQILEKIVRNRLGKNSPRFLGLSCPFPGNVYSAFRIARIAKQIDPKIRIILGGGFINTELRELSDPRVFDFIDEIIYDDGERALELILKNRDERIRTRVRQNGSVILKDDSLDKNLPFKSHPGPDYSGLPLDRYFSMLEMPNVMHRMWSDFRWNKLILAHGCYWKKCTFCDVSLDYIARFEPQKATQLVDQIERIIEQTGTTGFHFVDEAAPPALLRQISTEILKRKLKVTWWGNIRFDSQFDDELTTLMADAGCVAVTGGLEVASPRILKLINKGLTIEQTMTVTKAFKRAGIYVHAYLMYGFPSQTKAETIESLEVVRQLFKKGHLDSAHWHRFVATAHSPVGQNPKRYGIRLLPAAPGPHGVFSKNQVDFVDEVKTNHDELGASLRAALYNYMHGAGLNHPAKKWFKNKTS